MLPEKVEIDQEEEETAFNAATDSLVPEFLENPMEEREEPSSEKKEAVRYFLGEMTEEQALEALTSVDSKIEAAASKIFGKFGEVNQRIQELQGREFTFDPEKLAKTKELDEGIAAALAEDLKGAFAGSQLNIEELTESVQSKADAIALARMEERFLSLHVPNAQEISQKPEFARWFHSTATDEVRDTFKAWDEGSKLDSIGMIKAFQDFEAFEQAEAAKRVTATAALKGSTEERQSSSGSVARRILSEEEAFASRSKELNK